jgi:hypothetical protein
VTIARLSGRHDAVPEFLSRRFAPRGKNHRAAQLHDTIPFVIRSRRVRKIELAPIIMAITSTFCLR